MTEISLQVLSQFVPPAPIGLLNVPMSYAEPYSWGFGAGDRGRPAVARPHISRIQDDIELLVSEMGTKGSHVLQEDIEAYSRIEALYLSRGEVPPLSLFQQDIGTQQNYNHSKARLRSLSTCTIPQEYFIDPGDEMHSKEHNQLNPDVALAIDRDVEACLAELCSRHNLPVERIQSAKEVLLHPFEQSVQKPLDLPRFAPEPYSKRLVLKANGRRENIVEFLRRVWKPWIDAELLTRADLRRLDCRADKAVENWLRNREMPPDVDLLTQPKRSPVRALSSAGHTSHLIAC